MSNNQPKRVWNFLKTRGYYLALALCAVAMGVAGYVYFSSGQEEPPAEVAVQNTAPAPVGNPLEDEEDTVLVIGTEPATEPTEGTAPTEKRAMETMWPVEGEVVSVFAADKLAYNATTQDWRVHHGVDLQAAEGTEVVCAADGTVYTVYEDDFMGTTVVVRHADGFVTTYASLSPEVKVEAGQKVAMGQTLGTVGQTALTEKALGHHVHFAVTCNEQVVDPYSFVKNS